VDACANAKAKLKQQKSAEAIVAKKLRNGSGVKGGILKTEEFFFLEW
jgi:hypothetical protein